MSDITLTDEERASIERARAASVSYAEPTPEELDDAFAAPESTDEPDDDLAGVDPLYAERMNGKPRFLIVETNLHTQISDGTEVLLPLDPPAKVFREVMNDQGDQEDLDQLFAMLKLLGREQVVNKLEDLGILELTGIVTRFFKEFQKKLRVEMGESSRSSRS